MCVPTALGGSRRLLAELTGRPSAQAGGPLPGGPLGQASMARMGPGSDGLLSPSRALPAALSSQLCTAGPLSDSDGAGHCHSGSLRPGQRKRPGEPALSGTGHWTRGQRKEGPRPSWHRHHLVTVRISQASQASPCIILPDTYLSSPTPHTFFAGCLASSVQRIPACMITMRMPNSASVQAASTLKGSAVNLGSLTYARSGSLLVLHSGGTGDSLSQVRGCRH